MTTDLIERLETRLHELKVNPDPRLTADAIARERASVERQLEVSRNARDAARAKAEARQAQIDTARQQRDEEASERVKEELWTRYRTADRTATRADFERDLPALLSDYRRDRMHDDKRASRDMFRSIRSQF